MGDYDLKQAVTSVRNKRFNFALYSGEEQDEVLITPRPASSKLIKEVEESCGKAKRLCRGICYFDPKGIFVFGVKGTISGSWEKTITTVLRHAKCESFLPVEMRLLGENEADTADTPETTPTGSEQPPSGDVSSSTSESGSQSPETKNTPPQGKTESKDISPQERLELDLEALTEQVKVLIPQIKDAIAAKPVLKMALLGAINEANEEIKKKSVSGARSAIERAIGLLPKAGSVPVSRPPTTEPNAPAKTLPMWTKVREAMTKQLVAIQGALEKHPNEVVQRASQAGVLGVADAVMLTVQRQLTEFDGVDPLGRPAAAKKVRTAVAACRQFFDVHPAVAILEKNPLGVSCKLKATAEIGLQAIEKNLPSEN